MAQEWHEGKTWQQRLFALEELTDDEKARANTILVGKSAEDRELYVPCAPTRHQAALAVKDLLNSVSAGAGAGQGGASTSSTEVRLAQLQQQQQQLQQQQLAQQERLEQQLAQQERLEALGQIVSTLFEYDDSNATAVSVPGFKHALMAQYSKQRSLASGPLAYCMLTMMYLPKSLVIGAHLWKRAWARYCTYMGFDDVNDIRNGLLLCKPLEWAFDNSKMSIIPTLSFRLPSYQAYVLDSSLFNVRLADKLTELANESWSREDMLYAARELGNLTFGDVHGRCLKSDGPSEPNPFSRVLSFQYRRSMQKAKQLQWELPSEEPPVCESSPGNWSVQRLLESMEEQQGH